MNNYQAESIKSLDYFEHIRRYPGMFIGSKDAKGLLHCVKEILSNSIDEYLNGAGTQIEITFLSNNGIRITDNGRGIPHGKHPSGCSILQACFGIANTGGKFDNATGQSGYNTSGGEHGTGGKAVNALSTKMICSSSRDSIRETVEFSRGKFVSHKEDKIDKAITGTSVEFYPDSEVLEVVEFDQKAIAAMVREFSFLCKGLKFIINYLDGHTDVFCSENGLLDFMKHLNGNKDFLTDIIHFEAKDGRYQVEVAVAYNSNYSSTIKLFTNNIPQEKGTHLTGFKSAWTSNLNTYARENGLLKEKDDNLSGSDYEEGMNLILNFKMIDPVFKGQNKEELSSSEGRTYVQRLVGAAFQDLVYSNKKDLKTIIDRALNARKARDAARKARDAARNIQTKKTDKSLKSKMAISDKFTDCRSKDPSKRVLLLVEGKSAAGSVVESRNVETDCVYQLRGKVLSVLKCDEAKVFANQELSDIINIIGAGYKNNFDIKKMNFDKIVITSDAKQLAV